MLTLGSAGHSPTHLQLAEGSPVLLQDAFERVDACRGGLGRCRVNDSLDREVGEVLRQLAPPLLAPQRLRCRCAACRGPRGAR